MEIINAIRPPRMNLAKRRIIIENVCPNCTRFPGSVVHALWNYDAAQDVWAGSIKKLQKCSHGQADMIQLMEYLLDRLAPEDVELFLVQAWIIWNQQNRLLHGAKFHDPNCLNKRAANFLEEYRCTQVQLAAGPVVQSSRDVWKPPPQSVFKLNLDAAIFMELDRYGFGAIIRNDKREAMTAMSAKGPAVSSSDEAEMLACRKAIEFAADAGFSELVIEGDNANVIQAISSSIANLSLIGNVIEDIHHLIHGLH